MNKKTLIVAGALLAALAAGLGFFWPFSTRKTFLRLPGIVEIQEVRLGSKVGGRVKDIVVEEGSVVPENQALVTFEAPELEAMRAQAEARVQAMAADYDKAKNGPRWEEKLAGWAAAESAKARYERLKKGPRDEETQKAKSDWESARADYKQAQQDFDRISQLFEKKSASRAEYDAALGLRDRLQGRAQSAWAHYDMHVKGSRQEDIDEAHAEWQKAFAKFAELVRGTRPEEIAESKARLEEARAKLNEIRANLAETIVRAPKKAVVEVIAVRKGDLVPPNQPIVRALYAEDLWVKAYVPETEMAKLHLQQKVEITMDTFPNKRYPGTIFYISPISEFTPRNVQSVDERRHQVFAIKVRLGRSAEIFHAGMAAEVFVPVP